MLKWLRGLLTRRRIIVDPSTGRRVRVQEEPPSRRLMATIILTAIIIAVLSSAQVAWLIVYGEWNSSIFQGLIAVLCIMLGALWGRKA
ncbi:MAG TPA: hypothetical protein ENF57_04315 [Candidatus Korarchaeota archaeon]|nr:hypothetical protein [Candidatus Korarchaeota archaeon]